MYSLFLVSTAICKNYTSFIFVTSFGRNFRHQAKCLQPKTVVMAIYFFHRRQDETRVLLLR
jgi:hypothetical protein